MVGVWFWFSVIKMIAAHWYILKILSGLWRTLKKSHWFWKYYINVAGNFKWNWGLWSLEMTRRFQSQTKRASQKKKKRVFTWILWWNKWFYWIFEIVLILWFSRKREETSVILAKLLKIRGSLEDGLELLLSFALLCVYLALVYSFYVTFWRNFFFLFCVGWTEGEKRVIS